MPHPELFVGIPAYKESDSLDRTVKFLTQRTALLYTLEVQVARQSVVKNKNALLLKARGSGARWIAFCDDDMEPQFEWDARLIDAMTAASAQARVPIGQVSPKIVYPDGRIFSAWINIFFDPELIDHRLTGAWRVPDPTLFDRRAIVGALPGGLTIFVAEFLEMIGWAFDNRYEKSQHDDIDQSLTCRAAGFCLLYDGATTAVHHANEENPRSAHENLRRLYEKWGSRSDLTLVVPFTERAVQSVSPEAYGSRSASLTDAVHAARVLLGVKPFHRVSSALRVLRRNGIGGVHAHCKRILMEATQSEGDPTL